MSSKEQVDSAYRAAKRYEAGERMEFLPIKDKPLLGELIPTKKLNDRIAALEDGIKRCMDVLETVEDTPYMCGGMFSSSMWEFMEMMLDKNDQQQELELERTECDYVI